MWEGDLWEVGGLEGEVSVGFCVTALDRGTRVLAREVVEVMERIEREDVG